MKWEHVDLVERVIHITENVVFANGQRITKAPKTQSGKRDISIGEEVVAEFKKAQTQYKVDKLKLGQGFHDDGYVVRRENGAPYRPDSITQKWERFVTVNDLPKIRLHDLRHSNATALIAAGVDIKTVQQRLGHSDVTTTLNIYTHVTQAMDRQAASTIDSLLFPSASGQ